MSIVIDRSSLYRVVLSTLVFSLSDFGALLFHVIRAVTLQTRSFMTSYRRLCVFEQYIFNNSITVSEQFGLKNYWAVFKQTWKFISLRLNENVVEVVKSNKHIKSWKNIYSTNKNKLYSNLPLLYQYMFLHMLVQ